MSINVYQIVTDKILAQLEKGEIPWKKPWATSLNGLAFNRVTKKPYSLINQLMLLHSGEYASLKQWSSIGGRVKKGEKSEIVVFWKMNEIEEKNSDGTISKRVIPILRYYNVFHISQIENVDPLQLPTNEISTIPEAEDVILKYIEAEQEISENFGIEFGGNKACYVPSQDIIRMPVINNFINNEEYYSTLFHEIIHSTGNELRLNRPLDGYYQNANGYAKEELIAEIGAMMLCETVGINSQSTVDNNIAYIMSWKSRLEEDPKLIVSAAGKAEKALQYILKNTLPDTNSENPLENCVGA